MIFEVFGTFAMGALIGFLVAYLMLRDGNDTEYYDTEDTNTRQYGPEGTIHKTEHLDVETYNGEVVCVWFRCQHLPFKQVEVDDARAFEVSEYNPNYIPPPPLFGLTLGK